MIVKVAKLLHDRAPIARGALKSLAQSLRNDLTPLLQLDVIDLPPHKARLTRVGGRCAIHGTLLTFDPWSPHLHRCESCGTFYADEAHYRWWIMNYQLWLAERSVHAAVIGALTGDEAATQLAERILSAACDRYLTYPNQDNVLGPSRPFFSTYLESIWLLQLAVSTAVIQGSAANPRLVQRVLDRVLEPGLSLISSYDEGASNRQVWNNAAMLAIGTLIGDAVGVERALFGPSGLSRHLTSELLADGTWYEGENYHLFAHRGLWYGVTLAQQLGAQLPQEGLRRYREGFVTPFVTALPDVTFPARRDSQYGVSLRQWRTAESCELGFAGSEDTRLIAALNQLYDPTIPQGVTGRHVSTAEAERNAPAARLTRASLGFKALLYAVRELPDVEVAGDNSASSVLLSAQGFGVIRRDSGQAYVALDYGHSGGGHGHPDRLNLWLVHGTQRWLEDVGTGSYVDPSLFWYRSSLAHNAPMLTGQGQPVGSGALIAWRQEGPATWLAASFVLGEGVTAQRSVTVMEDYLLDEVSWQANSEVSLDLPWHVDASAEPAGITWTVDRSACDALQQAAGGHGQLHSVERADTPLSTLHLTDGEFELRTWLDTAAGPEWLRCTAPGTPGTAASGAESSRQFFLQRVTKARTGSLRSVWCWRQSAGRATHDASSAGAIMKVAFEQDAVAVSRSDGTTDVHQRSPNGWTIRRRGSTSLDLTLDDSAESGGDHGMLTAEPARANTAIEIGAGTIRSADPIRLPHNNPLTFELGEAHYRRTEQPWVEAGAPSARVELERVAEGLRVSALVRKDVPCFAAASATNTLDNEHPDINSDGLQLYLHFPDSEVVSWLLVGEPDGSLRVTTRSGASVAPPLTGRWVQQPDGFRMECVASCQLPADFSIQVVVNETTALRERRQGQLVLTGHAGESWAYLRGDREDAAGFLRLLCDD